MNYRHAYHAGNFADLVKHAVLTLLLEAMTRDPAPLCVIDTHAGAGAYDLIGEMARKSGEAAIDRLMADEDAPEAFDMLKAAVSRANPAGGVRIYPGSPALVCPALRPQDRLIACELRPDDHAALAELLDPLAPQAQARNADGYAVAAAETPAAGQVLVHIDPPFERSDDYAQAARACAAALARNPAAVAAVWTPLKDLETFDGFLRMIEDLDPPQTLVAEARLRPLSDPMRLNGCALVVIGAPQALDAAAREACAWTVRKLGDAGNEARVWRL